MATRSTISVQHPDNGRIISVYCHWDGYLENNGRILRNHYSELDDALELVANGSISSLGNDVDDTVYYSRNRGEAWASVKPNVYENWTQFAAELDTEEYNYVFMNNEWHLLSGQRVQWLLDYGIVPLSQYSETNITETA